MNNLQLGIRLAVEVVRALDTLTEKVNIEAGLAGLLIQVRRSDVVKSLIFEGLKRRGYLGGAPDSTKSSRDDELRCTLQTLITTARPIWVDGRASECAVPVVCIDGLRQWMADKEPTP